MHLSDKSQLFYMHILLNLPPGIQLNACAAMVQKYYRPLLSSSTTTSLSSIIDFSLPWSSHSNCPKSVTATPSPRQ